MQKGHNMHYMRKLIETLQDPNPESKNKFLEILKDEVLNQNITIKDFCAIGSIKEWINALIDNNIITQEDAEPYKNMTPEEVEQAFKEEFGATSKELLKQKDAATYERFKLLPKKHQQVVEDIAEQMTISVTGLLNMLDELVYYVHSPKKA